MEIHGFPFSTYCCCPVASLPSIGGIAKLFATHPATEERVAKLMHMAQTGQYPG